MKCPFCLEGETRVLDSRESEDATRRRRECEKCEKRFTTYEKVEIEQMVVKKDGRREAFDSEKLKNGFVKACQKRPISTEQINAAVEEIEREVKASGDNEIPSTLIGEKVMEKLKVIDKVAYIRFASVYHEFEDVKQFEKEARKIA
ncbi:MAG: transcriptional regulator NrdR [Candidatus Micrarchaeota archaeon]